MRRLGFGTAQLTGPGYRGPRGAAEDALAVLRRAVERGVTLIDTADNYGPSLAEEWVTEALHPYPRGLLVAGPRARSGTSVWTPSPSNSSPPRAHLEENLDAAAVRLSREEMSRLDASGRVSLPSSPPA
ncbi:aldo/keto reductase [Streptomyces sp. A012304]|uniref:aldo/keto reductase n=1 Tax=Streptomyces sp. A012304 TaxID=375446 RepID=UPI002852907F|nr:aldo/keto reductase [Streptomyces sp. A012304]